LAIKEIAFVIKCIKRKPVFLLATNLSPSLSPSPLSLPVSFSECIMRLGQSRLQNIFFYARVPFAFPSLAELRKKTGNL
jgi:hypothetical protein